MLNRSPKGHNFGFDYSLNPYRGCSHACRYCYARESHTYLDLTVGEDFERVLFVKDNLPERLSRELSRISPDAVVAIGTVTDPYQSLEGRHALTRAAIQLLSESGHAFTITTKSPLIERDLDLLAPLGQRGQVGVHISLIALDRQLLHQLEPGTPPPWRRLETVQKLKEAGVPVGVFAAPIVPALTDSPAVLDELFASVKEAGANWMMTSATRLSPAIREYFIAEVARFDLQAADTIRRLYGPSQYVDKGYRLRLQQLLDTLYRRHQMGRRAPVLKPHPPRQQMNFLF